MGKRSSTIQDARLQWKTPRRIVSCCPCIVSIKRYVCVCVLCLHIYGLSYECLFAYKVCVAAFCHKDSRLTAWRCASDKLDRGCKHGTLLARWCFGRYPATLLMERDTECGRYGEMSTRRPETHRKKASVRIVCGSDYTFAIFLNGSFSDGQLDICGSETPARLYRARRRRFTCIIARQRSTQYKFTDCSTSGTMSLYVHCKQHTFHTHKHTQWGG